MKSRTHQRLLAALLLLVVSSLLACGDPNSAQGSAGQPVDTSGATDSSAGLPPPASAVTPPPPGGIDQAPTVTTPLNRNVRDSTMGSLCWARRAVVLTMVQQYVGDGRTVPGAADGIAIVSALEQSAREVSLATAGLPPEVAKFAERFSADLASGIATFQSRSVKADEALNFFRFEEYPDAEAFVRLAGKTENCVDT